MALKELNPPVLMGTDLQPSPLCGLPKPKAPCLEERIGISDARGRVAASPGEPLGGLLDVMNHDDRALSMQGIKWFPD
jgi:hypothetical protein